MDVGERGVRRQEDVVAIGLRHAVPAGAGAGPRRGQVGRHVDDAASDGHVPDAVAGKRLLQRNARPDDLGDHGARDRRGRDLGPRIDGGRVVQQRHRHRPGGGRGRGGGGEGGRHLLPRPVGARAGIREEDVVLDQEVGADAAGPVAGGRAALGVDVDVAERRVAGEGERVVDVGVVAGRTGDGHLCVRLQAQRAGRDAGQQRHARASSSRGERLSCGAHSGSPVPVTVDDAARAAAAGRCPGGNLSRSRTRSPPTPRCVGRQLLATLRWIPPGPHARRARPNLRLMLS